MSLGYVAIQWTPHKRVYDAAVVGSIVTYIATDLATTILTSTNVPSPEVMVIRATGTCAMAMLHVALAIGPAARLWPALLPLLCNRRHLGVATFLVALAHATLSIGYYHGFGVLNPFTSLLTSNTNYTSLTAFPFESLGIVALIILFLLAATSHDFWLKFLTPLVWKRLHLLVYAAYVALVGHVALGALQTPRPGLGAAAILAGAAMLATLHLAAAFKNRSSGAEGEWIAIPNPHDIPLHRARVITTATGTRIAVFRHENGLSAVTNVCAHQGGPLGEGRIIDGCVTCPWHGWQYHPQDGRSPPPFEERLQTYALRIQDEVIEVSSTPLAPGTPTKPVPIQPMNQERPS